MRPIILLLALMLAIPAAAQDFYHPPFMMQPVIGIKEAKTYVRNSPDQPKKLYEVRRYNRQGYVTGPDYEYRFDEHDRLVYCMKSSGEAIHVQYDQDGLVSLYVDTTYDHDTICHITTIRQIEARRHPEFGLCLLTFIRQHTSLDETDTIRMTQTFDHKGRIVEESTTEGWGGLMDGLCTYTYDSEGRLSTRVRYLYEYYDSMSYTYTPTERIGTGAAANEGYWAAITNRATLDGTLKEEHYLWMAPTEWDEPDSEDLILFDPKGSVIYEKTTTRHLDSDKEEVRERWYEIEYYK